MTLAQTYTRCLARQEGHAVYEKLTPSDMAPGMCGYVNENGDWVKIAQLLDQGQMNMLGWDYFPELTLKALSTNDRWPSPKTSSNIRGHSSRLEVTLDAAGLPVGGGTSFEYTKSAGEGAILVADGLIESARVEPTSVVNKWMKKNAVKVLKTERFKDAREKGLWVVTKTFKTPRALMGVLDSEETQFSWSVEASAAGAGRIAPGVAWKNAREDGTWVFREDPTGVVVLFCGVQWDPHRWFPGPNADRATQRYLAPKADLAEIDAVTVEVPKKDGTGTEWLKLVPEEIGDVEDAHFRDNYESEEEEEEEDNEEEEDE